MNARGDSMPRPHRIEIEGGPAFEMSSVEDTLLRGALRAGLAFPYECSVGGCGSCRFDLLAGDVRTLWTDAPGLSERERKRGKRLACQSAPLGDCRIKLRLDEGGAARVHPRRVSAVLSQRRDITPDMAEFSFALPDDAPFLPGQYALLYLPGVSGARAYSMCDSACDQARWRFIVRRVEGGSGSTSLFDHLARGQRVELDGPYGHAYLRDGTRDVVCVAGGSGLGPMLSVARGVLAQGAPRRVHFFLGLRSQAELGASHELDGLIGPQLSLCTVLSAPSPTPSWGGAVGFVHQAVDALVERQGTDCDFYFAGPPPMVDAMQELLVIQRRVPHERIHFDRFV